MLLHPDKQLRGQMHDRNLEDWRLKSSLTTLAFQVREEKGDSEMQVWEQLDKWLREFLLDFEAKVCWFDANSVLKSDNCSMKMKECSVEN